MNIQLFIRFSTYRNALLKIEVNPLVFIDEKIMGDVGISYCSAIYECPVCKLRCCKIVRTDSIEVCLRCNVIMILESFQVFLFQNKFKWKNKWITESFFADVKTSSCTSTKSICWKENSAMKSTYTLNLEEFIWVSLLNNLKFQSCNWITMKWISIKIISILFPLHFFYFYGFSIPKKMVLAISWIGGKFDVYSIYRYFSTVKIIDLFKSLLVHYPFVYAIYIGMKKEL